MNKLKNSKGKIILGAVIVSLALVGVFVGNNQQAEAGGIEQGSLSLSLGFSEIKTLLGMVMGIDTQENLGAASGMAHYQHESFLQGLSGGARDQFSVSNVGDITTSGSFTSTGLMTIGGLPTFNAGALHSYTNSTSTTATTQTLLAADILNYSTVIMDIEVGSATFTFPASSTLSAMVPVAGDRFSQCWFNATTTASQVITFAAGTGIDLEISTSSTNALTINPDGFNCFEYVRKPATATTFDIAVLMTHFDDGD